MCGITAIFSYGNSTNVSREELIRVKDRMVARGPDGSGVWFSTDGHVGLAHLRLAVIDLTENGTQPMISENGESIIVFNGEIYNHRQLRADLEMKGYRFRSNSDTEVLLHLYAEKGARLVEDLRGMYAFAIWDERKKGLFLARDPFGIKPLYFSDDGKTLRVASQVKALLAGGGVDTYPEPAGHVGFFLWGYVPEPYTLYKGINALPPGTSLWVDTLGNKRRETFCSISDEYTSSAEHTQYLNPDQLRTRLRELLIDSVRHHLVADVPVGVFLSSGLDSTTLAALVSEIAPGSLTTITLGFREYRGTENDETPLAEQVAKRYNANHRTVWVERSDFQAQLPMLLNAMDQPTTDGINNYFVSYAAVRAGLKVALSGLGGDEVFGSYPSFRQIPCTVALLNPVSGIPFAGKTFRTISAPILKYLTSPKYAGLLEYGGSYGGAYLLRRGMYMPWELPELLEGEMVRDGWRELQTLARLEETVRGIENPYRKVSALEVCWYMRNQLLRDTDWASMSHSLEVRVPLVDLALFRGIVPMLGKVNSPTKLDLAATPEEPLPLPVFLRAKTGFSIPVREWIVGEDCARKERGLRGWANTIYNAFKSSMM
jgi:asparagine synthase (glutamine-hydrolysing)